jgi:hypothetical protein
MSRKYKRVYVMTQEHKDKIAQANRKNKQVKAMKIGKTGYPIMELTAKPKRFNLTLEEANILTSALINEQIDYFQFKKIVQIIYDYVRL